MNRHPIREQALQHWAEHPDLNAADIARHMAGLGHNVQPATVRQWKRRHGLGPSERPPRGPAVAPPGQTAGAELAAAVWANVHSIRPWPDNPRKNDHAVPSVAASIMKFGYGRTFVAWRPSDRRMLVVGHTARLAVLHNLQHHPNRCPPDAPSPELIPVRWRSDWTDEEARAYAIADNKLGELSGWVEDDLARQLEKLQGEGIESQLLGFSNDEVARLLEQLTDDEPGGNSGEIDLDDISLTHRCPRCGFEFDKGAPGGIEE